MTATSAQDQFAKWAKLRRKHDKTLEEYEQCSKTASFPMRLPAFSSAFSIIPLNGTSLV